MLRREEGASLEGMMSGSLTKGRGSIVTSEKVGDKQVYSIKS